jgi:hypothetical protein
VDDSVDDGDLRCHAKLQLSAPNFAAEAKEILAEVRGRKSLFVKPKC